ncbi:MAG: hypothetical protein RLZZ211_997 [Bacteroidota bacterium]
MNRKNLIYTLSIIAVFIVASLFIGLYYTDDITNKRINLIMASLGTTATVLTLIIVFLPKSKFKGEIHCWNSNKPSFIAQQGNTHTQYDLISFKIINKSSTTLSKVQITCKLPISIINQIGYEPQGISFRSVKEALYTTLKEPIILGVTQGDEEYTIEHYIAIQKWNKGNIYISISTDQISVTTFCLKQEHKKSLFSSKFSDPLILT